MDRRCLVQVDIRILMLIDSLYMTDQDRENITENCISVPEERIVITHGTGTMDKTANIIASKVNNKTIILTGAMVPYKYGSSDGLFNLGSAIAFVQTLPHGVYIAMNGRYFTFFHGELFRITRSFFPSALMETISVTSKLGIGPALRSIRNVSAE